MELYTILNTLELFKINTFLNKQLKFNTKKFPQGGNLIEEAIILKNNNKIEITSL
jgi:hypothetical protein